MPARKRPLLSLACGTGPDMLTLAKVRRHPVGLWVSRQRCCSHVRSDQPNISCNLQCTCLFFFYCMVHAMQVGRQVFTDGRRKNNARPGCIACRQNIPRLSHNHNNNRLISWSTSSTHVYCRLAFDELSEYCLRQTNREAEKGMLLNPTSASQWATRHVMGAEYSADGPCDVALTVPNYRYHAAAPPP